MVRLGNGLDLAHQAAAALGGCRLCRPGKRPAFGAGGSGVAGFDLRFWRSSAVFTPPGGGVLRRSLPRSRV